MVEHPTRIWPGPHEPAQRLDLERLPERITTATDALATLAQLLPALADALVPGPHSRAYTRRGDNQAEISPWCDVCGARRYWRAATWVGAVPPDAYLHVERLRPYCRRCDAESTPMPASPAPVALGALEALHAAGRVLAEVRAGRRRPDDAEPELIAAAKAVRAALRDVEPMIRIDARCPWCGALSLVMWPERGLTNAHNIAGLVVCTHGGCECEETACRCRRRGEVNADGRRVHAGYRHTWTNADWAWLSRRIDCNLFDLARGES